MTLGACASDGASHDDMPDDSGGDTAAPDTTPATGGPTLAVVGTREEVALLDLETGTLTTVAPEGYTGQLRLSPGGTRIAWQHGDMWVGEADGATILADPYFELVDFLDDERVLTTGVVMFNEGFMAQYLDPPELGYGDILFEDGDSMHIYTSRVALDDERVVFTSGSTSDGYDLAVLDTGSLRERRDGMPNALDGACEPVWLLGGATVACASGDTLVVSDAGLDNVEGLTLPLVLSASVLVPVSDRAVLARSETVLDEGAVCFEAEEEDAEQLCIVEIDVQTGDVHRVPALEAQEADLTMMLASADGPTLLYAARDGLTRAHPDGSGATVIVAGLELTDIDW